MSRVILSCLLAAGVGSGCVQPEEEPVGATPPAGFGFETSESVRLDLDLTLAGMPLEFASVQVASVLRAPEQDGGTEDQVDGQLFFDGFTDAAGRVSASLSVPTEYEELDLVVHRAGASGPYTDEGLRTHWGPLAPSSRVTVTRAGLASQTIDLQPE